MLVGNAEEVFVNPCIPQSLGIGLKLGAPQALSGNIRDTSSGVLLPQILRDLSLFGIGANMCLPGNR